MSQQPGPTGEYFLMEEYILDPTLDFGTTNWLQPAQTWPMPMVNLEAHPWASSLLKQGHVTNFPGIDYGFHLHSGHQLSQSTGNWLPDTALAHQQPVPVQQGSNPSVPENRLNCDKCAKTFTRPDSLKRHLNGSCTTNGNNGQSTGADCLLCEKDAKTFSRADHLLQHLRGYHKLSKGAVEHYKVRAGKRTATFEEEV
ncbi:hypothetical protein QBC39DRAFT_93798 [Podospora conica]|nr:hypothetical protein QBC39DRAFT_93798 [Schizothecium conicum]